MWKIQRKLPPKTHYPSFLLLKLHNESVPVMFGRKNIVHGCLFSYILFFWSSQVLLNFQTGGLSCVFFRSPPLSITIIAIIRFSSSIPILLTAVVYPILFSRL